MTTDDSEVLDETIHPDYPNTQEIACRGFEMDDGIERESED